MVFYRKKPNWIKWKLKKTNESVLMYPSCNLFACFGSTVGHLLCYAFGTRKIELYTRKCEIVFFSSLLLKSLWSINDDFGLKWLEKVEIHSCRLYSNQLSLSIQVTIRCILRKIISWQEGSWNNATWYFAGFKWLRKNGAWNYCWSLESPRFNSVLHILTIMSSGYTLRSSYDKMDGYMR